MYLTQINLPVRAAPRLGAEDQPDRMIQPGFGSLLSKALIETPRRSIREPKRRKKQNMLAALASWGNESDERTAFN